MSFLTNALVDLLQILLSMCSWLAHGVYFLACSLDTAPLAPELPITVVAETSLVHISNGNSSEAKVFHGQLEVTAQYQLNHGPPIERNRKMKKRNAFKTKRRTHAEKRRSYESVSESPQNLGSSNLERVGVTVESEKNEITDYPSPPSSNDVLPLKAVGVVLATATESPSPTPFTYPPSVYSTPPSSYSLTPSPPSIIPTSPVTIMTKLESDCARHYHDNALDLDLDISIVGIGELGKRRGFKGAPLFTPVTGEKPSFLSLSSTFSTRNATPRTPISRSPTPRTPLATVTNFIRATPRTIKTSESKYKAVSLGLQDFYDRSDPFATSADSFFSSEISFTVIPTVNLDNFDPYHYGDTITLRTRSLKRKPAFNDLQAAFSTRKKVMETTIYDMSIYDIPTNKAKEPVKHPIIQFPPTQPEMSSSPAIVLIPPSAPTSPSKMRYSDGVAILVPDQNVDARSSGPQESVPVQAPDSTPLHNLHAYFSSDPSSPALIPISNFYENFYDFGPYHESLMKRSLLLRQEPNFSDLRKALPTKTKQFAKMETNRQGLSVDDADADHDNVPVSSSALSMVPLDTKDLSLLPAPCISPINYTLLDDRFPAKMITLKRTSSRLRPLVLPLRLAGLHPSASSVTPPYRPPVPATSFGMAFSLNDLVSGAVKVYAPADHGSKSLDDLIALLEATVFDFSCKEVSEDVVDDVKCDHWEYCDSGLLKETENPNNRRLC